MALFVRLIIWHALFCAIVTNLFVDFSRMTVELGSLVVGLVGFSGTLTMLVASKMGRELAVAHRWVDRIGTGALVVGLGLVGWYLGNRISILAASAVAWGILIASSWCAGLLLRWIRVRYLVDRNWEWDRIRVLVIVSLTGALAVLGKNLLQSIPDGVSRIPGEWIGEAFTFFPPLYAMGMIFPACLLSYLPRGIRARTVAFVGGLALTYLVCRLGIPTHEGIPIEPLQIYFLAHSAGAIVAFGVDLFLNRLERLDRQVWQRNHPVLNRTIKASCYLMMVVGLFAAIWLPNYNLPHLLEFGDFHQASIISKYANDGRVHMGHNETRSYLVVATQKSGSTSKIPLPELVGEFLVTAKDRIDLRIEGVDRIEIVPGLESKSKRFVTLKELAVLVDEFEQCVSNCLFLNLDDVRVVGDYGKVAGKPKIKVQACRVFAPKDREQLLFVLSRLDSSTLRVLNVDKLALEMVSMKQLKVMFPSCKVYVGKQHSHDLGIPYYPLFGY